MSSIFCFGSSYRRTRRIKSVIFTICLLLGACSSGSIRPNEFSSPVEPIEGVLKAFQNYQVVAIGESHNSVQIHKFLLALIQNPNFSDSVNDIVVEFGNSLYQNLADQYVLGKEVPYESLRQIWQNTTQPNYVWDNPTYEEVFKTVRKINQTLSNQNKVRILLGDPPINWKTVRTRSDFVKWLKSRDEYPVKIIRQEVLEKKHRALVLYGNMHFWRRNLFNNFELDPSAKDSIVNLLETQQGVPVFSVYSNTFVDLDKIQPNCETWDVPSLVLLRGNKLGSEDFSVFYPFPEPRSVVRNGKSVAVPKEQWAKLPMEEQFDALLFLGPVSRLTSSAFPSKLCQDSAYLKMRSNRMTKFSPFGKADAQRLNEMCSHLIDGSKAGLGQ